MLAQGVVYPFEAWVQAVFVVLFIILVVALLTWFTKQQKTWQEFIQARDKDWQSWLDRSELRSSEQMKSVAQTLERLSDKLDAHDAKVDTNIKAAMAAGERNAASVRKTIPRKPQ